MTEALNASQKAAARRRYQRDPNLSVNALAAAYGVGYATMHKALSGILRERGGRKKGTMTTEQMIRMRDDGITLFQIGIQAGLTESGVHRRISRHEAKAGKK